MLYIEEGSPTTCLTDDDLRRLLFQALEKLGERK
jgi:hypothetical protein